ncbi:hypothetical protein GIB67_033168 [Kingdonia uniflora]|uniref:Uncharacterized protein n=1 Tax=Kingdonia uniflora TaxID=39325 RepID=A0A7J7N3F1_9MAGN|nr:hypothetical protein GIB67_033168 [Kingdonia uniflora]
MSDRQSLDQQHPLDQQMQSPLPKEDMMSCVMALEAALLPCLPARELQAIDRSPHPSHQIRASIGSVSALFKKRRWTSCKDQQRRRLELAVCLVILRPCTDMVEVFLMLMWSSSSRLCSESKLPLRIIFGKLVHGLSGLRDVRVGVEVAFECLTGVEGCE